MLLALIGHMWLRMLHASGLLCVGTQCIALVEFAVGPRRWNKAPETEFPAPENVVEYSEWIANKQLGHAAAAAIAAGGKVNQSAAGSAAEDAPAAPGAPPHVAGVSRAEHIPQTVDDPAKVPAQVQNSMQDNEAQAHNQPAAGQPMLQPDRPHSAALQNAHGTFDRRAGQHTSEAVAAGAFFSGSMPQSVRSEADGEQVAPCSHAVDGLLSGAGQKRSATDRAGDAKAHEPVQLESSAKRQANGMSGV